MLLIPSPSHAGPYEPPPTYYAPTNGQTGETLKATIRGIISSATRVSYANARYVLPRLDEDPADPFNPSDPNNKFSLPSATDPGSFFLVYTGFSHPATWDAGVTWNREHTWPRSRGVGNSGFAHDDLHQLRGCNPSLNNSRGNKPFGEVAPTFFDPNHVPGVDFRGEMARAMMYMETRYLNLNLKLVDGPGVPANAEMGDLASMLRWHYEEPPNEREFFRNHLIYTDYQFNRNPFVDHPEFVWSIWGTQPNDSRIWIGANEPSDGESGTTIDLGRAISGLFDSADVTLNKSGATPTTFRIIADGLAVSEFTDFVLDAGEPVSVDSHWRGWRRAFPYNPGTQVIQGVSLFAPVGTQPGPVSGTLTIDNTDLGTTGGAGRAALDGDDVITLTGMLVGHATASFDDLSETTSTIIDLGSVPQGQPSSSIVPLYNLADASGFTADLVITGVSPSGNSADLPIVQLPGSIAGGTSGDINIAVDPDAPLGQLEAVYTIEVSDEPIPGAEAGTPLTLVVRAFVEPYGCIGDITGDLNTDLNDFIVLASNFGGGPGLTRAEGDLNADGFVNLDDFIILASDFGCIIP